MSRSTGHVDATFYARTRVCAECGETKSITEFGSTRRASGTRSSRCASCRSDHPREDRTAWMKDYRRRWLLRTRYGISVDDYDRMHRAQGGRCLVCQQPETRNNPKTGELQPLVVDHDHRRGGQVRGLLCCRCNRLLGMVGDDVTVLRRAAAYLDLRPLFYEAVVVVPESLTETTPVEVIAEDPHASGGDV